ncbi:MAG: glutamate cyclase domain-containing protein, partial [Chloroflexota bacterium]
RSVSYPLYAAAREEAGQPLTYMAANGLVEAAKPDDAVLVVSGAGSPPFLPFGETDGPLGTASICRAIDMALGAKPIVITEEHCQRITVAATEAAGVAVLPEESFRARTHSALALAMPYGPDSRSWVQQVIDKYKPKAMVFIEKGGPNERGVCHTIRGMAKSPTVIASAHYLVEEAKARGIFTIGIGDGGNEIGYGRIREQVKEIQYWGRRCQCPCGAGIATVVATDVLVSANISNWGAYGVAAMLAVLTGKTDALHDEDTEYRMLDKCVEAGGQDGCYGSQIMYVDGTHVRTNQALITMLRQMVANGLKTLARPF